MVCWALNPPLSIIESIHRKMFQENVHSTKTSSAMLNYMPTTCFYTENCFFPKVFFKAFDFHINTRATGA